MKTICLLLSLFPLITSYAQDIKQEEKLILNDTLAFLGVDFSIARMVNAADIDKAIMIRDKHGPYWSLLGYNFCQSPLLKYDFKGKTVLCRSSFSDSSYTKLDSDWVLAKYNGLISDQITQHVKNYPLVPGYKLGLIFIIDVMDKKKNDVTMYGVYIDLRNNTVLKMIKCHGNPDGFGYSSYWATGVKTAYASFTSENSNYIQRLKHFFKKKS